MEFDAIDWDDEHFDRGNTRHILSAGITPEEFEEALDSIPRSQIIRSRTSGNLTAIGTTRAGRELRLVLQIEVADGFLVVRPVTAFDAE